MASNVKTQNNSNSKKRHFRIVVFKPRLFLKNVHQVHSVLYKTPAVLINIAAFWVYLEGALFCRCSFKYWEWIVNDNVTYEYLEVKQKTNKPKKNLSNYYVIISTQRWDQLFSFYYLHFFVWWWKLFNPLTPTSGQGRISAYNINTISSRRVMRINNNNN